MALAGGSRCQNHQREHERARERSPSSRVTWTAQWKRVRAQLIRQSQDEDGTWHCEVCGQPIVTAGEVEVDHIVPVSEGGEPYDPANLRLAHRRCNRRLGGLASAQQRRHRQAEADQRRQVRQSRSGRG